MNVKRRTREATAERRARIIEAAIGLFGERGYYGFTIQELGKRCGLSNPGLLHYFPSKLDVLLQVLQELEARETEFIVPLFQQVTHEAGGRDAVRTILRSIVTRATSKPKMLQLLVELQAESLNPTHPAYDWWQRRDALSRQFFTDLLRPYVAQPESIARQLLALMDGLCVQWLRDERMAYAIADWDDVLRRFLPELYAETELSRPVS